MTNITEVASEFPIVKNEGVQKIYERAHKLAKSDLPILLSGETGSGKEILARYIHNSSSRESTGSFVAINCAAIPDNLLESELFGHAKGAFTDARDEKIGIFSIADGGTLFLDEVAEMSLGVQKKLLRALEYQEFYSLGSATPKKVNFRLICATNENLAQMVADKSFRSDLYHRIHACELILPPLRDRIDEIPQFVKHFIEMKRAYQVAVSPDVIGVFSCYEWPGNIRELKNVIEYALAILEEGENVIEIRHLPPEKFDKLNCGSLTCGNLNLRERERCFRENLVMAALTVFSGDYKSAAKSLGISKSSIYDLAGGKISKQVESLLNG